MLRFRQDENSGGETTPPLDTSAVTPPVDDASVSQEPAWSPSQDEFKAIQEQIKGLAGFVPTLQQVQAIMAEQNAPDPDDLDIDSYIEMRLQERIAPLLPIVNSAAQRNGQERMTEIFTDLKTKEKLDFDDKIAERFSHAFFSEHGDPVKAVEDGARAAAEFRANERKAGEDGYKASLKRGPAGGSDLPVSGSGNHTVPAAKSYDEVIERYAGQTEV